MKSVRRERWTQLGDDFEKSLRQMRAIGIQIIWAGKPGMVAWYGYAFMATRTQMLAIEAWWRDASIKVFSRKPAGAWELPHTDKVIPWKDTYIGE